MPVDNVVMIAFNIRELTFLRFALDRLASGQDHELADETRHLSERVQFFMDKSQEVRARAVNE